VKTQFSGKVRYTESRAGRLSRTCWRVGPLLACLASAPSCDLLTTKPAAREVPSISSSKIAVDVTPAWSHDGRFIAYHRRYPSTDGPPGVYLVASSGGAPRLVVAGDYFGPEHLSFSPDDKSLVADWAFQLVFIDVASGAIRRPMYTDNGVKYPDWSPDGRLIAYNRSFRQYFEPFDSAGMHLFDLTSGENWPLYTPSGQFIGAGPRWSPDGRFLVAVDAGVNGGPVIARVTPDGSERVELARGSYGQSFDNPQWVTDPIHGRLGVLFDGPHRGQRRALYVSADGSVLYPWDLDFGRSNAVSPDSRMVVYVYPQAADSAPVLFTRQILDPARVSRRQLTFYRK
jgi:Tol biopolymer transport system component